MPKKLLNAPAPEDVVEAPPNDVSAALPAPVPTSANDPDHPDFPVGQIVGVGAERTWIGDVEYLVGEDGRISGPA